jgi:hypothetical protein
MRHDRSVNPKLGVHAIVRHDPGSMDVTLAITVVAVVPTKEEAKREVERLQEINRHTGCRYFWTPTRYYPAGRGIQGPGA